MTNAERRQRIDAVMGAISDVFVLPESGGGMAVRAAAFHVVHLRDLFESAALLLEDPHRARAWHTVGASAAWSPGEQQRGRRPQSSLELAHSTCWK